MSVASHGAYTPVRHALVVLAAGALATALLIPARAPAPASRPAPQGGDPAPRPETIRQALSNAGCSAAACHGGPATNALEKPPGVDAWKSSATLWLARDPHTRAYEALTTAAAARIMKRLRAADPGRWASTAAEEPRCLACHTNPALASPAVPIPSNLATLRAEGVGCEACHGNAGGWVYEHTTWAAADRPTRYESFGMAKLFDLGERALACAGCHVGAPANPERGYPLRDVNHDLIAAGHPRLNFDFADAQRRLFPHWCEKDRTRDDCLPRGPEVEMKAWLTGRVASAEAACRLLADRAERRARKTAPWPEFAESNCFACHHEIQPRGWRKDAAHPDGRGPGSPRWQTIWPVTRAEHLDALAQTEALGPLVGRAGRELEAVRNLIQVAGIPHTGRVREHAAAAAAALRELRQALQSLPDRAAARVVLKLYEAVAPEAFDWDEACQIVHGLAAMERTRLGLARPPGRDSDAAFGPVFDHLTLPRPPGGVSYDSPRGYDPELLRRELPDLLFSVRRECWTVVK